MPSVAEIRLDPGLRAANVLAGDPVTAEVTRIGFIEDLDEMAAQPAGVMAILGHAASAAATGYRLDIALRQAAAQGVAAVVFTGDAQPVPIALTAVALADRAGIVVASAPSEQPVADLIVAATAAVSGDAQEALRRVTAALRELEGARSTLQPADTDGLLALASEALGVPVRLAAPRPGEPGEVASHVLLHGQHVGTVRAAPQEGHAANAGRIVVAHTAAAVERSLEAASRGDASPIRSRDAILSELLVAGDTHASRLAEQARQLGLPIGGWHRALLLQLIDVAEPPGLDFLHILGGICLRAVRRAGQTWHLARWEGSVVLIEMCSYDPETSATRHPTSAATAVLEAAQNQFPQLAMRCGVGTAHQDLQGLKATVAEARNAAAQAQPGGMAGYDAAGLQRMLLEWYGSDTARQASRELLEPLERLRGERATTAIQTLQIYLDERGSLVRAAERLHVHRNAVAYRMRQIATLLDVDLESADQRLAVQLACRARLLR